VRARRANCLTPSFYHRRDHERNLEVSNLFARRNVTSASDNEAAFYNGNAGARRFTMLRMINIIDVTHHYGVRPVLRQINLQINRGELVALMGPNGSGKSTLMSLMAGALWPLKGRVKIDGQVRRSSPEVEAAIRKQVVYLPADPWLPLPRTGREWLLGVGRVWGVEIDRLIDHIDRLLDLFDLTRMGDSPLQSYSTGQRKKIALAAALVTEAPVMLLDEPFAGGLDPSGILALKRVLQHRAVGDHYTIVFATPVPELVEELADRVGMIADGRLMAFDTIAKLREQTGTTGKLDEIYEKLVSPQTGTRIDRYLEGVRL
jgi:ABC-type multidrug transport system ATPase subunit